MGILRVDKLSGLETPTPVTGSVLFDGNDHLDIDISNGEFAYGTGDFTWELWFNADAGFLAGSGGYLIDHAPASTDGNDGSIWAGSDELFYHSAGVSGPSNLSFGEIKGGVWYHAAVSRKSGTTKLFLNGLEVNSATDNADFTTSLTRLRIADYIGSGYNYIGYISNLRIVKGTALYTSNFTPKHELEVIGDTVLLCCNNPDSVTAASYAGIGTSRIITTSGDPSVGTASTEFPGLTRDFTYGTEFRGVTTFDTQGYFVPPSGTTEQRGRGRGLFGGGNISPTTTNTISYIQIQTQGNAQDFGDLTVARYAKGLGSSTRGLFTGGFFPSSPSYVNTIDFVTIATTGDATDFGDINDTKNDVGCLGNETRGIMAGGDNNNTVKNTIDFVTIASLGDATDFGDLTVARADIASFSSSTRGVLAGGTDVPNAQNVIDYITIASAGDAVDFGDTLAAIYSAGGCSSSTRGVIGGGQTPSTVNTIQYVTISTTGNTQDFGDLTEGRRLVGASSNKISGVFAGGLNSPSSAQLNTMNYVTIATTGNTKDFGDLMTTRQTVGALSDSHGGLS